MPKGIRFFLKFISVICAFVLIMFALIVGGVVYFNSAPPSRPQANDWLEAEWRPDNAGLRLEGDVMFLEVRQGETANSVGNRLESAGVIRNRYFWYLYSRLSKDYLKTGSYMIELPASQTEIHSILTTGKQLLVKVTIPEGVTLKKTARILESSGVCGAEAFLTAASSREILDSYNIPGPSMEGYLYPDTYFFQLSYPASKVVQTMADTFFSRVRNIAGEIANYPGSGEFNQRVIIASIVEREYRVPEEAAVMAGVFYNRLGIGMALQSCATVEYVITEIQDRPHPGVLYNRDLEIRNPYNTYLRPGLPPGPISAPGEIALRAAFNPSPTEYLYFRLVDSGEGRHYFSRTLDDHIRAGALYVKGN